MSRPLYVWTDLWGEPELAGVLDRQPGAVNFVYSPVYEQKQRPALDPVNLPFGKSVLTTKANHGVFGVFTDAGPDTWGRLVLKSLHPARFANWDECDILEHCGGRGVGALLFSESRTAVKPRANDAALSDLGAFAEGMQTVEMEKPLRGAMAKLMGMGTSLGGGRPKLPVFDAGRHWIAKFRGRDDVSDTPRLEWAFMRLADLCRINAAEVRHVAVAQRFSVLVARFDREPDGVRHYASAHALWNLASVRVGREHEQVSYAGIAELLRHSLPGVDIEKDLTDLYRRMLFNVLIGNTDDHGWNHGFLMDAQGAWTLAPAFDVLPNIGGAPDVMVLGIGADGPLRSVENALSEARRFGIQPQKAAAIAQEMSATLVERLPGFLEIADVSETDRVAVKARMLRFD